MCEIGINADKITHCKKTNSFENAQRETNFENIVCVVFKLK